MRPGGAKPGTTVFAIRGGNRLHLVLRAPPPFTPPAAGHCSLGEGGRASDAEEPTNTRTWLIGNSIQICGV
jgi:hypothetical protein